MLVHMISILSSSVYYIYGWVEVGISGDLQDKFPTPWGWFHATNPLLFPWWGNAGN